MQKLSWKLGTDLNSLPATEKESPSQTELFANNDLHALTWLVK